MNAAAHVQCRSSLNQIDPFIVKHAGKNESLSTDRTPKRILKRVLEGTAERRLRVKGMLCGFSGLSWFVLRAKVLSVSCVCLP